MEQLSWDVSSARLNLNKEGQAGTQQSMGRDKTSANSGFRSLRMRVSESSVSHAGSMYLRAETGTKPGIEIQGYGSRVGSCEWAVVTRQANASTRTWRGLHFTAVSLPQAVGVFKYFI